MQRCTYVRGILSGKFCNTIIRPWNKFENDYTDNYGRFHAL